MYLTLFYYIHSPSRNIPNFVKSSLSLWLDTKLGTIKPTT